MSVKPTLARATRDYFDALAAAVEEFHNSNHDHGRNGAISALQETVKFIQAAALGYPPETQITINSLTEPFQLLAASLHDLQYGAIHPIIQASPVHNRRSLPSPIRLGRGTVAAAMEILIWSGIERDKAAQTLAKNIEGSELLLGVKRAPWKAISTWRDDIRSVDERVSIDDWKHNVHARPDVVVFDYYLSLARPPFERKEWDENRLRLFADMIVTNGGWTRGSKKGRANLKSR